MALDKVIDSALLDAGMKATADAIREKTGGAKPIQWTQSRGFADEIDGISTGTPINNQNKTITQNGTYTADDGYTGLGTVSVNVASLSDSEWKEQYKRSIERAIGSNVTTIPENLTRIGAYAFYNYIYLNITSLPGGVKFIGEYAFSGCSHMELTSLPEGLKYIYSNAFYNCSNVSFSSIPAAVTEIGDRALASCWNIRELTFKGKPTRISGSAFQYDTNLLTINVPWAEAEVANAPWGATNATINYNYTGG